MKVNVISSKNGSAVISWVEDGTLQKGIIPSELIIGNEVVDEYLTMAIPFGIDWALALESVHRSVTVDDLAKELRRHGIWTLEDAQRNPQAVQGAILSAYGVSYATVMKAAEEYQNLANGG